MGFIAIFLIRIECFFLFLNPVLLITGIVLFRFLKDERRGGVKRGMKANSKGIPLL